MNNPAYSTIDKSEIYAMVSFSHKEREGEKNANFFFYAYSGIVDATRRIDPDIKIEWHGPNAWDPVPEIKAIQELTDRQVDGIVVSAADETALDPAINAAIQAGIPVINFDADSLASERLTFVGTDNYKAGYLAGRTMAEGLGGPGDVAVSTIRHAKHLAERLQGFEDAMHVFAPQSQVHIAYDSGSIDMNESGRQDFTEYRQNYIRMLQAHPEVRGLFATYATPGAGAVEAVDELGLQGQIYVLTFDFDELIIKLVGLGKAQATVGQDPYMMGYVSMILLHAARHAPEMPTKADGSWRLPALVDFLNAHPTLHTSTAAKLREIISQLETQPGVPAPIDTGARILGLKELLDLMSGDFENMRDSISEKVESLGQEVEVRKQAERELRRLNEELEQRVIERTRALSRANEELEAEVAERRRAEEELARSNAALEQFAYVASHDLQEPLRMVTSYVQILAEDYGDRLDADADRYINYAVDGASRMKVLIDDLLAFSRVGSQGKPFEPTDCGDVMEQAIFDLEEAIKESRGKVTWESLPTVMADATQLTQLLRNLVSNGIKFRGEEPPHVHVSVEPTGSGAGLSRAQEGTWEEWLFSVRDNGIGIAPKHYERIFQMFQRLHHRSEYPGTGIGLAICQKIVERHGGRIWVESEPGKGSTFYFTIPNVPGSGQAQPKTGRREEDGP